MQIHYVHPHETVYTIAKAHGRHVKEVAEANGIRPDTDLTVGMPLLIPRGEKCPCGSAPCILVIGEAKSSFSGTTSYCSTNVASLFFREGGHVSADGTVILTHRDRLPQGAAPTLLTLPLVPHARKACESLVMTLSSWGYAGLCMEPLPHGAPSVSDCRMVSEILHGAEQTLAVKTDGDFLLNAKKPMANIYSVADLIAVTPPANMEIEPFLSHVSAIVPREKRCKILLRFSYDDLARQQKKRGTRAGRPAAVHQSRTEKDYVHGIERLVYDGYAGVVLPIGRTSPFLYHLVTESGNVICPSQRNGMRSRS